MSQEYNAPSFIRLRDNQGHNEIVKHTQDSFYFGGSLRPGDGLRLEVEVDSSFDPADYTIRWTVNNIQANQGDSGAGPNFSITLSDRHVSENLMFSFELISNKSWHRHGNYDARMTVGYRVLPPII